MPFLSRAIPLKRTFRSIHPKDVRDDAAGSPETTVEHLQTHVRHDSMDSVWRSPKVGEIERKIHLLAAIK